MFFENRKDAGEQLATALAPYKNKPDVIVLALPRGGVPVAYEIARTLHAPLDLMLVRKLGVPGHEELAMGAIADGNIRVLNADVVRSLSISPEAVERAASREHAELERRSKAYRQGNPPPSLKDRTVILVDDGCATGANMKAAIQAAAKQQAARIVVAVPVASDTAYALLCGLADEVICLNAPELFYGVGAFYQDFTQTSDAEVKTLLQKAAHYERA